MDSDRRFSRSSWAVLALVAGLLLLALFQVAVRFTLPTDGWEFYTLEGTDADDERQVFDRSLIDGPTPLQTDDELLGINDYVLTSPFQLPLADVPALAAEWAAGRPLRYTVLRDGQAVGLDVLPRHWTAEAWLQKNLGSISGFISSLVVTCLLGVSLLTFFKRPGSLAARALLIFCTAVFTNGLSSSLPDGVSVVIRPGVILQLTAFFSYVIFGTLLAPSLLLFTLVFPRPKAVVQRHPILLFSPYLFALGVAVAIYALRADVVGWLATMGMFFLSLILLVHSGFTAHDAISRAQMRWAVGGMALGLGFALLTYLSAFEFVDGPLAEFLGSGVSIGFVIIGVSLAVAVLRYRLFDIDLIIRRTLVYTLLTAVLALVYFGSVVILETAFRAFTGGAAQSQLAIVASTLTIAALFSPLRRRVQNFIDRRFFRRKYDAAQTLAQFAAAARDETNLDELTGHLVSVVGETMQPASVSLWLVGRVAPARPEAYRGVRE